MNEISIHKTALKHGLTEQSIREAWDNFIVRRARGDDYLVAIGFDSLGREIEMVALVMVDGSLLIIHGMSPSTEKLRRELGLRR